MTGRTFCFSCTIAISSIRPLGGPSLFSRYGISYPFWILICNSCSYSPWSRLGVGYSESLFFRDTGSRSPDHFQSLYVCSRRIQCESWAHQGYGNTDRCSMLGKSHFTGARHGHSTQLCDHVQPKQQVISKQLPIYNQSSCSSRGPIANTNSDHTLSTTYQRTTANS